MDSKLAGWKAHNLSLAGRVTLASSVLNAIPSFVMHTAFLLVSVCEGIDKKIRNFIWGSVEVARKIHNINWDTVCKPKSLGGLGIRSALDLNKAFLIKVVWGLMKCPNDLWVRVLVSKYLKKTSNGYVLARKTGFSSIWRGILKVWPHVTDGLQWSINNGRNTHFWTDRWVDSEIVLIDHALNIRGVDPSLRVADVCSARGEWNSEFLLSVLPYDVVMQVIGMSTPKDSLGDDALIWGLEPKGSFSIRSAYLMLSGNDEAASDHLWNRVWKWNGPNKIKHFLWLASHDRLMTNVERNHRHLNNQVWKAVLPEAVHAKESYSDFFTWWRFMLEDDKQCIRFGITAWLLWKARNKLIFDKVVQSVSAISEQCVYWTNLCTLELEDQSVGSRSAGYSSAGSTDCVATGRGRMVHS
ncbi:Putative ribonuclease H protein At1g65750 [Linum perenne]